jgi:hypothetical protein
MRGLTTETSGTRIASPETAKSCSDSQEHLCSRCRLIDLERIFESPPVFKEWSVFERQPIQLVLDILDDFPTRRNASCEFCDLLWQTLCEDLRGKTFPKLGLYTHAYEHRYALDEDTSAIGNLVICQSCSASCDADNHGKTCSQNTNYWLHPRYHSAEFALRRTMVDARADADEWSWPRLLQTSGIDYGLLKRWIDECGGDQDKHEMYCKDSQVELPDTVGLRLIDCSSCRVVQFPNPPPKFVALSYVWGARSHDSRPVDSDELPSHLPLTIRDAITVTKRLGFRYLWIDRLCIRQNDEADKARQVPHMGLIYRLADLTIIAAAGEDPEYGLPGVSMTPRSASLSIRLGDKTLVCSPALSAVQAIIKSSAWSSRAWTYQEAMFSRRRLFFTTQQVYWECSSRCYSETLFPGSSQCIKGSSMETRHMYPEYHVGVLEVDNPLWARVKEYMTRRLGDQSDILNAFQGVLQEYRRTERIHQLWGIPIPTKYGESPRRSLLYGMTWHNTSTLTRRPGFPSWSWVGWRWDEAEGDNAGGDEKAFWLRESRAFRPSNITVSFESSSGHEILSDMYDFNSSLANNSDISSELTLSCPAFGLQLRPFGQRLVPVLLDGTAIKDRNEESIFVPCPKGFVAENSQVHCGEFLGIYLGWICDVACPTQVMVVEKVKDTWQRVGFFETENDEHELPLTSQKVRLG